MQIAVIDLEWTTDTINWPSAARDIIEIGACDLNTETGQILRPAGRIVRPTAARVSRRCTLITGISPAAASAGIPFAEACAWLQGKCSAASHWASFGETDKLRLAAQCKREGLAFPLPGIHIDIRRLSEKRLGWWRRRSLAATMAALGLEFIGRPHGALADAENTARVLHAML